MSNKTSKKRNTKKTSQTKEQESNPIALDIILWAILAFSLLLFLGNLGLGGVIGSASAGVLFGLFGILAYIVPILICIGAFFFISNRNNKLAYIKLIFGFLMLILLDLLIELFINGSNPIGPTEGYVNGSQNHVGGGFFGALLAFLLTKGFGLVGAYVIDIILMIVSSVMISERALLSRLRAAAEERRVLQKQRNEKRREEARARAAEREAAERKEELRIEKKVPKGGMNLDLLTINGASTTSDEVSPIDIEEYKERSKEKEIQDDNIEEIERVPLDSNNPSESTFEIYGSNEIDSEIRDEINEDYVPVTSEVSEQETYISPYNEENIYEETQADLNDHPADTYEEPVYEKAEPLPEHKDTVTPEDTPAQKEPEPKPMPKPKPKKPYILPDTNLLNPIKRGAQDTAEAVQETAKRLQTTLENFGVNVKITEASIGPAVTRYELSPEQGVKVSRIVGLADDIKLNLAAEDIRIEAPIPGKAAVGIEVPNKNVVMVPFREMMETAEFKKEKSLISFAAGKDIGGKTVISDIAKMPHVLIAGATGSGKSVCINTIIMSILYHASPDDVKFIMIDPKVVELSVYNGIPHLLVPVVTDPKKAAAALNWAVREMTDRYNKFASAGVRDMKGYNAKIKNGCIEVNGEKIATEKMPQIVVIVDELADLMMVASGEVEEAICRLAQLARAAGIHLIIATQRPSVNVITGLIKANMPSRIAFAVTSGVDSRTILDMNGAEKLLGKGDMLYYPQGAPKPMRVQGAFVSDEEVEKVCDFIRNQEYGTSSDTQEVMEAMEAGAAESGATSIGSDSGRFDDGRDQYFADAGRIIIEKEKGSIGMLQRSLKIGFNRAARIMDQLEEAGVVGPEEGTKPRKILLSMEEFEAIVNS
ncbi:MAG: DNA translocase FtsK [Lachnospiraceae bacterium]|nr:DNA translocase FtsK [Lachnospiraceae bacterium]